MPQRKCSVKSLKQSQKRRLNNLDIKTALRKTVKEYVETTKTDPAKAVGLLSLAYKKIDKAAKRNVLHKNTASRRKASLAKLLKATKA